MIIEFPAYTVEVSEDVAKHCKGLEDQIASLTAERDRYKEALEKIIYEADEYDGSPANELYDIAKTALTSKG